ncbi:MAG: FAD-linked oxidase C-terminal domain-containing protein, partial [Planctomycetota bacterium]
MHQQVEKIKADLEKILPGKVHTDFLHRAAYSCDASIYTITPQCVITPWDKNDIVTVVKYANKNSIPIAARGAASGVAGESLCSGLLFDMTRDMNKILDIKDQGKIVVCEPGVVLSHLNKALTQYNRKIGPDPSTANRATIGGCIANNATGAHSIVYGYMGDYVESIEAVLADGTVAMFTNNCDPQQCEDQTVTTIAEKCLKLLSDKQEVINKALPSTKRNRSGYSIANICHDGKIDLVQLLAGSEGTLAVFTKITLRTVPLPPAKALLQLEFDSIRQAADTVPTIVETGASACEMMDKTLIEMAHKALPQYRDILPASCQAVLLIEHTGQDIEQVKEKIEITDSAVAKKACGRRIFIDETQQARLWKSRKDAVPLLDRKKGKKHPVPFIEDISVNNRNLGDYVDGMKKIAKNHDIPMSFYGHAGDGELHIRPYLDLGDPSDLDKMKIIANQVYSLVWSLKGSISGEHADGLLRAAFIRGQYGDDFYELLCEIKKIFDPQDLMNPGKIINPDPEIMTANLRAAHPILPERVKSDLLFDKDELTFELERCNGCGLCLSTEEQSKMCPVFRAASDELSTSRAKANILRKWATGQLNDDDFESPEFRKFLDLCINCKACTKECPSGIDISMLVTAARTEYAKRKGLRRTDWVLGRNRYLGKLSTIFWPISNLVMRIAPFKWMLEKTIGIDRTRNMPKFEPKSFLKAAHKFLASFEPTVGPTDRVAYFTDTYANYNDHELGFAVLEVLRYNNIEVILPKQLPVPLPAISYGDVKTARRDLNFIVKHLAAAIKDGYKIICSEPSAALCLQHELRHYVAGKDAQLVSQNTFELMDYLLGLFKDAKLKPAQKSIPQEYLYHCPCHLYASGNSQATLELLTGLTDISVTDLNSGCCGIAGTFGMKKKNQDLSLQIAKPLIFTLEAS